MNYLIVDEIRKRTWHALSPQTAHAADMTVDQLKQFIARTFMPSDTQLRQLANHFSMKVPNG